MILFSLKILPSKHFFISVVAILKLKETHFPTFFATGHMLNACYITEQVQFPRCCCRRKWVLKQGQRPLLPQPVNSEGATTSLVLMGSGPMTVQPAAVPQWSDRSSNPNKQ